VKSLILAFQFLTIIPMGRSFYVADPDHAKCTSYFVLVGLFQGIALVASDLLFGRLFHPDLTILIVLLTLIASNGAFHLDALADTFDALAVRGDREEKLSVMKDGAVGPIGVVSIISVLGLKYLALRNISHLLPFTYYSSLLLMPVISKWAMVWALFYGRPAREDGLGVSFIGKVRFRELSISTAILIAIFAVTLLPGNYVPANQVPFYGLLMVTVYLLSRLLVPFYTRHFGGLTGDTVGSISEITEVGFLIMVIAWSRFSI